MWRNKNGSKWRSSSRRMSWGKKDKNKSSIVYYECKKLGHFKLECPDLEKRLISTWEVLDNTSSNEDNEEANICLTTYINSEGFKSDFDDEVNFDDPESHRKTYHELLSNSSILSKAYKNLQRDFKNLFKDHLKLESFMIK
ncbi:hypothetical protein GmHk_11G032556 [Glycine max]|nr:hypothetical protein GmHk_11G032556 [Glycine max]